MPVTSPRPPMRPGGHGIMAELLLPSLPQWFFFLAMYGNRSLPFLSITLHLKISCPSSPAVPMGRGMACPVPQVKIEMESDYDSDIDHHHPRDMSSETTLWGRDWTSCCCWQDNAPTHGRHKAARTEPIRAFGVVWVSAASAFNSVPFWQILLWMMYEILKLFIYLYNVNSHKKRGNIYLYVLYSNIFDVYMFIFIYTCYIL